MMWVVNNIILNWCENWMILIGQDLKLDWLRSLSTNPSLFSFFFTLRWKYYMPVYFYILKVFLKKFKNFIIFFFVLNYFFMYFRLF